MDILGHKTKVIDTLAKYFSKVQDCVEELTTRTEFKR